MKETNGRKIEVAKIVHPFYIVSVYISFNNDERNLRRRLSEGEGREGT